MTTAMPLEFGTLEAQIATADTVDVRSFQVEEGLSRLFVVSLEVLCSNPDIDLDAVVGQPASFSLRQEVQGGIVRTWSGVCRHIEQLVVEDSGTGLSTYSIEIVPRAWFMTQRRNHRIFQQKSEPQIALALLEEWSVDVDTALALDDYPTRDYRVQFAESDFAFLSRMLEDAGITYYFERREDRMVMVLSDEPTARSPRPSLRFVETPMTTDEELVTNVRIVRRVRPGRYTQRDVDYRRPPTFPVVASQEGGLDPESLLERFHYTPGAFLFAADGGSETPVGDDRGSHRADVDRGAEQVRRRLDAKRGSARVVTFVAQATGLRPGEVTAFTDHPKSELAPDRTMLVVAAVHDGYATGGWSHRYEARFTDTPFRPPLHTPKPVVAGIESATVVGPAGEEIHVDELGRIRVHFHWDRESEMNERSSCWVPVSHAWGGAGYGAMNIPRVGQEVIVDFLNGDPDRPVVVGRVYTSLQKVPYELPANKTQSGLKSYSSPASGGYNELMFEDAAGGELVRFQAERDWNGLVKNDARTVIGHDNRSRVGNDEVHQVGANQYLEVGENRVVRVLDNQYRDVQNDLVQRTRDGKMIDVSKDMVVRISERMIAHKVGTSMIIMQPDKIIIQADQVHINPGSNAPPCPPGGGFNFFGNP